MLPADSGVDSDDVMCKWSRASHRIVARGGEEERRDNSSYPVKFTVRFNLVIIRC